MALRSELLRVAARALLACLLLAFDARLSSRRRSRRAAAGAPGHEAITAPQLQAHRRRYHATVLGTRALVGTADPDDSAWAEFAATDEALGQLKEVLGRRDSLARRFANAARFFG
jgi:hypothetical protein